MRRMALKGSGSGMIAISNPDPHKGHGSIANVSRRQKKIKINNNN